MRGPLREIMEENLAFLRGSGLLNPVGIDGVRKLFRIEPHGPAWSRVWALATLGHWLRTRSVSSRVSAFAGKSA
jgi:hypothetical protein